MSRRVPDREELLKGCQLYEQHEQRDAMYKVATFLLKNFWGNYTEMTNGLGVLLLTWNNAFYRFSPFSFDDLENCISKNFRSLDSFRQRNILSFMDDDKQIIKNLFMDFLKALQDRNGRQTPVGVAKALHLLGPEFFPLWDNKIAKGYGCNYTKNPGDKYLIFCEKIKSEAGVLSTYENLPEKPIIKILDEYNYSRYTNGWI